MKKEITEQDVANFYDNVYYKSETVHAIRPIGHYQKVFDFFGSVRRGAKILDVGCGTGLFLKVAGDSDLQAYGVDISQKAIDIAKRTVPAATVVKSKGEELPFEDANFDYVFFGGTLEHFLDVDKGLSEALRVGTADATYMIVVPNKNYWLWRVRGTSGTHQGEVQELLLDYNDWGNLFKKHGLKVERTRQDPWPWDSVAIFKFKNPWKIIRRAAYRFIWLFIPLQQTYQFVFICKKA